MPQITLPALLLNAISQFSLISSAITLAGRLQARLRPTSACTLPCHRRKDFQGGCRASGSPLLFSSGYFGNTQHLFSEAQDNDGILCGVSA